MRILIAHDAGAGAGGVESYLAALMPALVARGHELAFLHHNSRRHQAPTQLGGPATQVASVADDGLDGAIDRMRRFDPAVCFSHNMRALEVDERLAAEWPTVKMMHGYFGTCISAQKAHSFPSLTACDRTFGAPCLALYLPRHCGQLRPGKMAAQFTWALRQQALFKRYAEIVVASDHMAREYARHGVPAGRLSVAALFSTADANRPPRTLPAEPTVLFAGRMTPLKGGDVLVRAAARANGQMAQPLRLILAGEGPARNAWQALATRLGVAAEFTGWVGGAEKASIFRRATLAAVPSLWPEPFGLVGLEAAVHGIPTVAFDTGGISQWLRDGINGRLVAPSRDERALGDALASLLDAPQDLQRLGDGARRVAREMTIDAHLDALERVFLRAARTPQAVA